MIVIKLGGSLAQSQQLLACLHSIERNYQGKSVVIVPGGGSFADQVRLSQRVWQFDDRIAHEMAILAMQQMALLFHGLKRQFVLANSLLAISQQLACSKWVIWSPDIAELDHAGIAASWDVTSDSLAAWLASELSADALMLIKSATINQQQTWQDLADLNLVDKAFTDFAGKAQFPIIIMSAQEFNGPT